jgi:hypothetical protein
LFSIAMKPEIWALMDQIREMALEKGLTHAKIDARRNAHGEMCVGLIIPPRHPGEWDEPKGSRDDRRASREKR